MGRKHRRKQSYQHFPSAKIPGVPRSVSCALDRLGRPEVSSHLVKHALSGWGRYVRIPRGPLRLEKDYSDEHSGEWARMTLEAAMCHLGRRRAEPLRRIVARMDAAFEAATVPDPFVDPGRPWWQRRDWF